MEQPNGFTAQQISPLAQEQNNFLETVASPTTIPELDITQGDIITYVQDEEALGEAI